MSNAVRAESDSKFILRFLVIGIVLLGFGAYCLYDGFIQYPHDLTRSKAFFTKGITSTGESGWIPVDADLWQKTAEDNGWVLNEPKKPDVIEANIIWQYGMAAMSFLVGFPILFHYLRSKNAWIQADGDGLSNHKGQSVAFSDILQVDKTRWEKKGIAKIEYSSDGQTGKFIIDDLKFLRTPADQIMHLVESNIEPNLVFGARLESELEPLPPEPEPSSDNAQ